MPSLHRYRHLIAVGALAAAVLACGTAGPPAPSANERATYLAQTAAAILTATAALITPPSSPTLIPTLTALPSVTATTPPTPTLTAISLPTHTPSPEVSPTPCENNSAFVTDVTVPDGTHFAPGAAFVKTWRLRNDGVCAWTVEYTFRYVAGDALSGTRISLPNPVPAGETIDLSVSLTAPAGSGTFRGEWQMHTPAGEPFGSKPYVEIVVP